jgi:four helix bundle protein
MTNDNGKNFFRFRDWGVYKLAQDVFQDILRIVSKLPAEVRYTLGNQIIRSALSVVLNIAEGSGRNTDKELNRFFNIAIGSINETVAGLDALLKGKFIDEKDFEAALRKACYRS